ncbi:MAG: twin-arginine translocase subunit TatC [Deltaproteobacteria bacterium]|nr:twin-arginine translocase subunit TatC [Deltaproteobacteria bacterium]
MNEEYKIPFTAHLEELRTRLITCSIAIGAGFAVAYFFKEKIFQILTRPLMRIMQSGDKLIFTGLPEAFFTYLKVALLAGIILAAPVLLYQFWLFVAPGLYQKERKLLIPIVFLSTLFFVGGAFFGYFIVFPFGFKFFLGFASESIRPMPSMKEYLTFASKLLLAFGVVFELPIVITFLARLGIVSVEFLKKNRKYAMLIFFAGAAILTPPDVITQLMMAFPLMVLYEVSIVGAKIFGKKKE